MQKAFFLFFTLLSLNAFTQKPKYSKAILAGGCFWCMEPPFEKLEGVISVISGFTGGDQPNPKYKDVSQGKTGHIEAIEITYDPQKIDYNKLLFIYWRQINPTDSGGQFVDRGFQYTSAIFFLNEEQQKKAVASKENLEKSGRFKEKIVTRISPAGKFYPAEDYHQDYYKKNPLRYKYYRYRSGRDQFLSKIWQKK